MPVIEVSEKAYAYAVVAAEDRGVPIAQVFEEGVTPEWEPTPEQWEMIEEGLRDLDEGRSRPGHEVFADLFARNEAVRVAAR